MCIRCFHKLNFCPYTPRGRLLTESERLAELIAVNAFRDKYGRFPTAEEFRAEYPELVWGPNS